MKNLLKDKYPKIIIVFLCAMIVVLTSFAINGEKTKYQDTDINTTDSLRQQLPPLSDDIQTSLSFINDSLCIINDPTNSIHDFITELKDLLDGKDTVINIVHIGDSHIQAGFLSGCTMRMLQHSFGNAGRGWIAPFKLTKTNEPTDYFISSNVKEWIAGKCIQATPKCPWGIGGIGIETKAKNVDFRLSIAPNNGAGYSFNKVMLFRDNNAVPMTPSDFSDDFVNLSIGRDTVGNIAIDTFNIASLTDSISMNGFSESSTSALNRYYGFSLENGHSGILYHSIGVNGAMYKNFTDIGYVRQLSLLKPSLMIVSFGTNEASGRNFDEDVFTGQLNDFVSIIRREMPQTALLITTPAESYKRISRRKKRAVYIRNENIEKVADAINSYSKQNGIAVWDLYAISGGENSCKKWFDAKLFSRDRIHFSREAYTEQGTLLYKAIIRYCITALKAAQPTEDEKELADFIYNDVVASRNADKFNERDSLNEK